jgi:hypothetical protein
MSPAHPSDGPTALFERIDDDHYQPSLLTQGPWSPEHQFGGAAASLLATAVEELPTLVPQQVARLTVDLFRPVPVRRLQVTRRIVREGKRIQVVEAALVADGVEVARCSALRLRLADLGEIDVPRGEPRPGPQPEWIRPYRDPFPDREPPGVSGAAEFAHDGHRDQFFVGPTWVRMKVPVVAGQEASPLARMTFTADFASGIGQPRQMPVRGINADLSLSVVRPPRADWLCFTGTGWTSSQGIGHSQALISDDEGVAASVSLTRLVDLVEPTGR